MFRLLIEAESVPFLETYLNLYSKRPFTFKGMSLG